MSISLNDKIGNLKNDQITIKENINNNFVSNLVFGNLTILDHLIAKNDEDKFLKKLKKSLEQKYIPFPLTKQIELYLINNQSDLKLIYKYLAFRYKFFLCSSKLIDVDHPSYLLIEPVSTCNLRCPFCYQTDTTFTKKPFMGTMKFSLFKKVIDEADKIGVGAITIGSRGEPSLHKQITDFIDYLGLKKNIFEKKFITNATRLDNNLAKSLLKNNINIIQISADHYKKKDYEELRLKSHFETIVNNVDNLYNLRKNFFPKSISEIRVSGVDSRKNLNRDEFKKFWIKRSDHVSAGLPVERWNTYLNVPHPELKTPCQQLWDRMYVWFDGKVNPCDADYKSFLSYGDAERSSLHEIWSSPKIKKLRKTHLNKKRGDINPCDRCGVDFEN